MARESDHYGRYLACLFCGAHVDLGRDGRPIVPLAHVRSDDGRSMRQPSHGFKRL